MDRQQFTERAQKLEARLYRIGYGLLREEQDRRDAVQEALLKAWRHCGHLKDDAYFDTWLTRIFINECTNIQRRQGRQRALDERMSPPRAHRSRGQDRAARRHPVAEAAGTTGGHPSVHGGLHAERNRVAAGRARGNDQIAGTQSKNAAQSVSDGRRQEVIL